MKLCPQCRAPKPSEDFSKDIKSKDGLNRLCKEHFNSYSRNRYAIRVAGGTWKDNGYESREKLRDVIFAAYGNICTCCGESERRFLTIEHIGGGGARHRQEAGNQYRMMLDIIKQGFPKDKYTILCILCNFGTRYGHTCPHQEINVPQLVAGIGC